MKVKTKIWYHLTSISMSTIKRKKKEQKITTVGGNAKLYSHCGKQFLKKLKMDSHDLSIPLYVKELRADFQKEILCIHGHSSVTAAKT